MKQILSLSLCLLLSACAILPPSGSQQASSSVTVAPSWETRRAALSKLHHWDLQGALSVQNAQGGDKANVRWQQFAKTRYQLQVWGPMGAGRIKIVGTPEGLSMQSKQGVRTAPNARELLKNRLGWDFPVQYLFYWVRGIPVSHLPAQSNYDSTQRLKSLQQAGWQVHYLRYQSVGSLDLPTKFNLQKAKTKIRIVIRHWTLA